ncbi:MAG: hypothetical protein H7259_07125 [Cytophagales bacterium]|nr:hypothetical protein [Cytophaga sp.]
MKPVLVVLLVGLISFQVFSQEEKVLSGAKSFFASFKSNKPLSEDSLFISKDTFWKYLSDSYLIGDLNDTLKKQSENTRIGLLNFWKQDVELCQKKATELYKINWKSVVNETYTIEYQERSSNGFMFRSHSVSIRFVHKKIVYLMLIDGFVAVENKTYILANEFILRKEK